MSDFKTCVCDLQMVFDSCLKKPVADLGACQESFRENHELIKQDLERHIADSELARSF